MDHEASRRRTMVLRSELSSVDVVEHAVEQSARDAGFDADTCDQVAMVAREATVNAVLHGNRNDASKHLTARLEESAEALIIAISDEGSGFDPSAVPDPLLPENLLRSSGRGIFLMRAYMDEVHFRQLHPGQEIVLVKHKSTSAATNKEKR